MTRGPHSDGRSALAGVCVSGALAGGTCRERSPRARRRQFARRRGAPDLDRAALPRADAGRQRRRLHRVYASLPARADERLRCDRREPAHGLRLLRRRADPALAAKQTFPNASGLVAGRSYRVKITFCRTKTPERATSARSSGGAPAHTAKVPCDRRTFTSLRAGLHRRFAPPG